MPSPDPAHLSSLLGAPLFSTDLYMPRYQDGSIGRWRLTRSGFSLDRGYYSGLWAVSGMPVLMRDAAGDGRTWETWMSLSPHELESQELGCRHARGHTVVMGLGMGWVAINIALRPQVRLVTVIERDPEVIDLFRRSRALDGLADGITGKIRIIEADALAWRAEEPVDFLYADIWRTLEEPRTLDDVSCMQANVQAGLVYFWGQELVLHGLAEKSPAACLDDMEWTAVIQQTAKKTGLPLLLPGDINYAEMIATVVRRRRERWPGRKS